MKNLWISLWILLIFFGYLHTPVSGQNLVSFQYEDQGTSYTGFVHVMFFTNKDKEVTPFPQCAVPQLNFFGTNRKGIKAHFSGLKWADTSHKDFRLIIKPSSTSRLGGLTLHTPEVILQEDRSRELKYSVLGEGVGEIRIDLNVMNSVGTQQVGSVAQEYTIFNQAIAAVVKPLGNENGNENKNENGDVKESSAAKVDVVFAETETSSNTSQAVDNRPATVPAPELIAAEAQNEPAPQVIEETQTVVIPENSIADVSPIEKEVPPVQEELPPAQATESPVALAVQADAIEPQRSTTLGTQPVITAEREAPAYVEPTFSEASDNLSSRWAEVLMNWVGWPLLVIGGSWLVFLLGKYLVENHRNNASGKKKSRMNESGNIPKLENTPLVQKATTLPEHEEVDLFEQMIQQGAYFSLKMDKIWVDTAVSTVFVHQDLVKHMDEILDKSKATSREITGFLLGGHQYNDLTEQFQVTFEKFVPFHFSDGNSSPVVADQVLAEISGVNTQYPDLAITGLLSVRPEKELVLSARDQALFQGLFGQRYQLFMQIDPASSRNDAAIFSRTRSGRMNEAEEKLPAGWLQMPSLVS